jgi:D-tagatose-1,6-bisphosphate aldolase subunit GatZ/KbaZ
MPCGGEALDEATMAARAADLAAVAEGAAGGAHLTYGIGTEVPAPGGETAVAGHLAVTTPDAARRTVDLHRAAFSARGLAGVMDRVAAVVVQPGVDFGNRDVTAFDPGAAAPLAAAVPRLGGPLFEAHSTDYQPAAALRALTAAHFAVLKVGPELTFAWRQAVLAQERLALLMGLPSGVEDALRRAMQADPGHWRPYVDPGPDEDRMMLWGLSDRVRYYWTVPAVQRAVSALFAALRDARPPPGLVAQVTGGTAGPVTPATLPDEVTARMVGVVVARYRHATEVPDAPQG